jgi:hypothetical protein
MPLIDERTGRIASPAEERQAAMALQQAHLVLLKAKALIYAWSAEDGAMNPEYYDPRWTPSRRAEWAKVCQQFDRIQWPGGITPPGTALEGFLKRWGMSSS